MRALVLGRARFFGMSCAVTEPDISTVCAVVVAYHPDEVAMRALLRAVAPQVGASVVVDNTPEDAVTGLGRTPPPGTTWLPESGNVGLAAAQNDGIAWALQRGFRYVLMLDQDSLPGDGMVAALLEASRRLNQLQRVAAVGPRFHDLREDRDAPFVRIGFPFNRKRWATPEAPTPACDFLIASGALMALDVLADVGGMDAGLFIDNVDLEWCFRARARGYGLHGVYAATMHHRLGDTRRALPFGLGQVVVHGSLRLFYMMRNRVLLYRLPHTPTVWIAQDLPRALMKLILFGLLIGPRRRNLRYMLRGLADGLRGKSGACSLSTPD